MLGSASAQNILGQMYTKGRRDWSSQGVSKNNKEAMKWFLMVAKQEDNEAQDELANVQARQQKRFTVTTNSNHQ